jgi:RNA polymerase sigma factor (sigma-70 family)
LGKEVGWFVLGCTLADAVIDSKAQIIDRMNSTIPIAQRGKGACFVTTHWSVVLGAGQNDTTRAQDALGRLCQTYWYPLYAYVRQRGHSPQDAQDLTQEFFARFLLKKTLREIKREGGKFRSFLLTAMNHFLVDEWRKVNAEKRGAGQIVPLDAHEAETRYGREPVDKITPEKLFEQNWALALLDTVYTRLEEEYEKDGKKNIFKVLRFCLMGERSEVPYAELANRLGITENTVKTLVHRLRGRYRGLLREEVGQGVATQAEAEEELRCLFRALAD